MGALKFPEPVFGAALCHAMRLASTLNALGWHWRGSYWLQAMDIDQSIRIRVNGEQRQVAAGLSIADMLSGLGLDPAKVAVERNREIVPRSLLGEVTVEDGDQYEIVHFVGGG
jgi:thiazole synthase